MSRFVVALLGVIAMSAAAAVITAFEASRNSLILCMFPLGLALIAGRLIIVLSKRLGIRGTRQLLALAILYSVLMIVMSEALIYQAYVDSFFTENSSIISNKLANATVDEILKLDTGYTGYIGYKLWVYRRKTDRYYYYAGLPHNTDRNSQIIMNYLLPEGAYMLVILLLPLGQVFLYTRRRRAAELQGQTSSEVIPIAHFRDPGHPAALETFAAKNWQALAEMVFAGRASQLPALEIYQSRNVDPITRQPYLQLIQRDDQDRGVTIKVVPVNTTDLSAFKGTLHAPDSAV